MNNAEDDSLNEDSLIVLLNMLELLFYLKSFMIWVSSDQAHNLACYLQVLGCITGPWQNTTSGYHLCGVWSSTQPRWCPSGMETPPGQLGKAGWEIWWWVLYHGESHRIHHQSLLHWVWPGGGAVLFQESPGWVWAESLGTGPGTDQDQHPVAKRSWTANQDLHK